MNTTSPSSIATDVAAAAEFTVQVSLPVATQTVVAVVTFCLLVFFIRKYTVGLASWEVCYVSVVEFITYIIMLALPQEAYILEVGTEGQTFVWLRYASWLMTCPVLLQMIAQVVHHTVPDADFTTQTMMAFIMTAVMGITSTLYKNPIVKWTSYAIGVVAAVCTFALLYSVWRKERSKMDPLSMPARYELIVLMCFTWTAFPITFALSPESTGIISQDTAIVIFAVLDLFCKNMYGYMCWYFNYCNAFSHRGTELGIKRENSLERLGKKKKKKKKKRGTGMTHSDLSSGCSGSDTESSISSKDGDDRDPKLRDYDDVEKAIKNEPNIHTLPSAIDMGPTPLSIIGSPSLTLYPAERRPSEGGA